MLRTLVLEIPRVDDDFVAGLVKSLDAEHGSIERFSFRNGNLLTRLERREPADLVVLVAGDYGSRDGHLVELGLVADSIKRAWGSEVWCVLRYLPYSRGNRITEPLTPLGAKVFTDVLCSLPIDRFVTFNLHAPELLGFFSKPVIGLDVLPLLTERLAGRDYDFVVGTDRGRYDECSILAERLDARVEFCLKKREGHSGGSSPVTRELGHLEGARVLLFDDECEAGTTSLNAARQLSGVGVEHIDFCVVYDFYADPRTYAKLAAIPQVDSMIRTNLSPLRESVTALPVIDVDCSALVGVIPRLAPEKSPATAAEYR